MKSASNREILTKRSFALAGTPKLGKNPNFEIFKSGVANFRFSS